MVFNATFTPLHLFIPWTWTRMQNSLGRSQFSWPIGSLEFKSFSRIGPLCKATPFGPVLPDQWKRRGSREIEKDSAYAMSDVISDYFLPPNPRMPHHHSQDKSSPLSSILAAQHFAIPQSIDAFLKRLTVPAPPTLSKNPSSHCIAFHFCKCPNPQ